MKNVDLASIDFKALARKALHWLRGMKQYVGISFFVLLAVIYGLLLVRITALSSAQPDPNEVNNQASSGRIPKIDSKVVRQLESLEESSANVKALFDQARQNPFEE